MADAYIPTSQASARGCCARDTTMMALGHAFLGGGQGLCLCLCLFSAVTGPQMAYLLLREVHQGRIQTKRGILGYRMTIRLDEATTWWGGMAAPRGVASVRLDWRSLKREFQTMQRPVASRSRLKLVPAAEPLFALNLRYTQRHGSATKNVYLCNA